MTQTSCYNHERFNSLADVEVADKERKASGSLEIAMSLVAPIFVKYGMCDKWAITLLHNHWSVSETELPIQETTVTLSPMEMESTPHAIDFAKPFWPLTLAVSENGATLEPMEFTTDPQAAISNSALEENPDFTKEICETLRSNNFAGMFGLIVPKENSLSELEFVEYNPEGRISIVKETLSSDADRTKLIETSWRVNPFDLAGKCEKSCFSRCTVSGGKHSHDHAPAHKPGA
jgi:hypothetical protein